MTIPFDQIEALADSSLTFFDLCRRYPADKSFQIYQDREQCVELGAAELRKRAETVGTRLQRHCEPRQRALLLLPGIDDFVTGLLACFHANVVAVPTVVDPAAQTAARAEMIAAVLGDSESSCVLTDATTRRWLEQQPAFVSTTFITITDRDEQDREVAQPRTAARDDLAMIMYTSGSTSLPKGVMINHRTLLFQAAYGAALWEIGPESTVVSWLAITHNFGLPLAVLTPLLTGAGTVLMAPEIFVQYPEFWLELIDRHAATHTGATNSALELCVNTIDPAGLSVSLNHLTSIFCAGEPIRERSVAAFAEAFAPLGLRPDAVRPHYGLTEVGCLATESSADRLTVLEVDVESLGRNQAEPARPGRSSRALVRNGRIRGPVRVEIVDPDTRRPCPSGQVGEVWFKSTGTCQGYYGRPEENAQIFDAALRTTGERGFFRTGDLGFLDDGRLYLVGRAKELLIVNGMKFHPPDLETTLRRQITELRRSTAVFAVEGDSGDQIILVQELSEPLDRAGYQRLARRVNAVVSDYYGIALHDIVFTAPDAIPRSGIGKVKRNGCRTRYLDGDLPVWFRVREPSSDASEPPATPATAQARRTLAHAVVAPVLSLAPAQVLAATSLGELGCTSTQYIQLARRIEEVFRIRFTPGMIFKYHLLDELAEQVAGTVVAPAPAPAPVPVPVPVPAPAPTGGADHDGAVAVIGLSCRFPGGANDADLFWHNLETGKDGVSRIADSRPQILTQQLRRNGELLDLPEFAAFTDGVDEFDAAFFGIAPVEAEAMDPQQRRLMELTWHLFEDGGYRPSRLRGRPVGVYVGAHANDYAELLFQRPDLVNTYGAYMDSGTHPAMLANRVSRWYDLHGPSRVFNTACSSSLVALSAAVTDLRAGLCSEAVVAGVNTLLSARSFLCNAKAGMQAADGRCKTFDDGADGYVRAEGYGAVLLKPLAAAERDGDRIHGVIRGVAVNHDGRTDSLRAPSPRAQADLIVAAYADADVSPSTVSYVEAHGTGTALGDPIEVQGLIDAFHRLEPGMAAASCGLGSVKTAVGHLESAAGMAGLIKLLLCMRHKWLPGLLHYRRLNSFIDLDNTPFRIVEQSDVWKRLRDDAGRELPLRAGLSSFGFGGANAHVIVEEHLGATAPASSATSAPDTGAEVVLLSASTEESLRAQAQRLIDVVDTRTVDLSRLARALRAGREELPERLAFAASGMGAVKDALSRYLAGERAGDGLFTGNMKQSQELAAFFAGHEDLHRYVQSGLTSGDAAKALDLWVKGVEVDWSVLDDGSRESFPSLPLYPFSRERHWFPEPDGAAAGSGRPGLHPLLHENISDFAEQRFRTAWTGREFFLRDHLLRGRPSAPGAVWVEAARAAAAVAYGAGARHPGLQLSELRWHAEYSHDEKAGPVDISLTMDDGGMAEFDCYRSMDDAQIFLQGRAQLLTTAEAAALQVRHDVPAKDSTGRTAVPRLKPTDVVPPGADRPVHYGPAYRAVNALSRGRTRWTAELSLPDGLRPTAGDYVAHPVLLAAALHIATLWPASRPNPDDSASAVVAMDQVIFRAPLGADVWAIVTESATTVAGEAGPVLDLDLCDAEGELLMRMLGLRVATRTRSTHQQGEVAP